MATIFYTDGSTLNNGRFGKQISRVCVTTGSGELLVDHMIGDKTNIESEAFAILAALKRIDRDSVKDAEIRTDSRFWQRAVESRWKLKEIRLFPLRDKLYELFDKTGASIIWVPREQNPAGQYLEANPTNGTKKVKSERRFAPCPHCGKPIVIGYKDSDVQAA